MSQIFRNVINAIKINQPKSLISFVPMRRLASEKSYNQVILLGRVGTEPMAKGTEERPVVVFSLATNVNVKTEEEGEYTQKTNWHRISVFKQSLRRVCMDHVKKGSRVFVQGRISYHSISESNTLQKLCSIVADEVILVHTPDRHEKTESMEEID